jgi:hypothetical protein
MAGLRHDAAKCREAAKSELIRHSLGIETPEEKQKREAAETRRKQIKDHEATQGPPLFPED